MPYCAVLLGMFWLRNAWIALLGYHLGMAVILTLGQRWSQARSLRAGYSPWWMLLGILGGIGAGVALYLYWPFFGVPPDLGIQLAQLSLTPAAWPFFMLYFILVNPWLEELYWRDYLGSPSYRPTWHDFFFAGFHLLVMARFVHWPWLLCTLVILITASWAWRQIARTNRGLLVPVVCHILADVGILFTVYLYAIR
ncbi:MAG: CPBP family glutamic-type intramembrane protease [Armatimonadota bacterium]